MSQSHELQLHIAKLNEIRSILNSMKNLALIETHKLARLQILQTQAVAAIETVINDLLSFYPHLAITDTHAPSIRMLVGTERGFCGDFNEQLIHTSIGQDYTHTIAVGSRLSNKLTDYELEGITLVAGANVTEEVPLIVYRLIDSIAPANDHLATRLTAIYYESQTQAICQRQLLPLSPQPSTETFHHSHPPLLNLAPEVFFSDLLGHYLLAVLHEILYLSLAAENNCRLQHLEGAVNHLDDETTNLHRKVQVYRQEEITEEIEVILLNAENL
jgi:F-type H+-transporting ATPase subunit gamma